MACAVFVSVCIFKILPYVFTESYEVDFRKNLTASVDTSM